MLRRHVRPLRVVTERKIKQQKSWIANVCQIHANSERMKTSKKSKE